MKKKSWTVMVYLAGDNNLDSAGATDLNEMKKVGSGNSLNIVAQFDRHGTGRQTHRYFLTKGGLLRTDAVANLGETNTGDPGVLIDFVNWAVTKYPATRYMLVIWNHGAGWDDKDVYNKARGIAGLKVTRRGVPVDPNTRTEPESISVRRIRVIAGGNFHRATFETSIDQAVRARAIAFDDNAKDFLDNIELKRVARAAKKAIGRKLDVLGLDACLMSMAEIGYQLRDCADFTVGSEELEPGDGWPYNTLLGDLARKPAMKPGDFAKVIVKRYLSSYRPGDQVTQSACDLSRADALRRAVDGLAIALRKGLKNPATFAAISLSRLRVQSYDTKDYVDLKDLCGLLAGCCKTDKAIVQATKTVKEVLANYVIASGSKGSTVKNSHGVSIHFPSSPENPLSPLYNNLDFARDGKWQAFLLDWLQQLGRGGSRPRRQRR